MISQQFQQPEPPNKVKTFMKDVGRPILTPTIAGIIVFVATVWIGKIQIINFNWLMLLLALIQVIITVFLVWYCLRAIGKLQEKYQADVAGLRKEYKDYMAAYREYVDQEIIRWNEREQVNAKGQKERLEEVKKQLAENIGDAENRMDSKITSAQSIFSSSVQSYKVAVDSYKDYLFQTMKRMDTLEERLPESKE